MSSAYMSVNNHSVRYWSNTQSAFLLAVFGLSLLCSIWLCALPLKTEYAFVVIEPIVYMVGLFFVMLFGGIKGVGSIILVVIFFFKLCVMPIVNHYGDYASDIGALFYLNNWELGCVGIAAEWIVCAICLIWYASTSSSGKTKRRNASNVPGDSPIRHPVLLWATIILTVFVTVCLVVFPNYRYELFPIWGSDTTSLVNGSGPIFYLFKRAFEIGRILLCFYGAYRLSKSGLKHKRLWIALVAVISVVVQSEYRILGFFVAIVIIVKYIFVNDKGRLQWMPIIGFLSFLAVAGIAITTDFGRSVSTYNISRLCDIYFGGYMQAAASWGVEVPNGIQALLNAVWNETLVLKNVFGEFLPSVQTLKYDAFSSMGREFAGRIFFETAPLCWKTYGILAPLGMALPIIVSLKCQALHQKEQDSLYSMVYLFACTSTAVFVLMYSHDMVLSWLVNYILPLCIAVYLDRRYRSKSRNQQ